MKKNCSLSFLFGVLVITSLSISSCNKDIIFADSALIGANVSDLDNNTWIYNTMKEHYFWSDSMPVKDSTKLYLLPMDYFYSILYKNVDRFSWIEANATTLANQLNGINTMLGIKVTPFLAAPNQTTKYVFVIACVYKNSPADSAGLKRGDVIMSVGGQEITNTNYNTILSAPSSLLGMGEYTGTYFEPLPASFNKTITKSVVQIKPILNETILDFGAKKVGYFAYLQFLKDYDDELRGVFGRFKEANINELVIDLRYNGGGYVSSSNLLSALIVNPSQFGNVMNTKIYNKTISLDFKNDSVTKFESQANNIGNQIQRVFILTSQNTASASELIINNLKPFMEVILVGENTYGKNVGSHTITNSNKKYKYALQPITFKILNSVGESDYGTTAGFTPQNLIGDTLLPYYQLGDQNETFLKTALTVMGVDFTNRISGINKIKKTGFARPQRLTISDNRELDRNDMWANPINK
ncbi:MAG: S41 family peptidase [Sediminibacterium sp.]